jgi:hypothetical protein
MIQGQPAGFLKKGGRNTRKKQLNVNDEVKSTMKKMES